MTAAHHDGSSQRGFSLTELLTVLGIMTAFLLISIPNIMGIHENYLLRTNMSGIVSYLKLGRMKAVANNQTYVVHVDPSGTVRDQCAFAGNKSLIAVYRDSPAASAKVEQCFVLSKGLVLQTAGATAQPKAAFKANGMCENKPTDAKGAPNWFVLKSRNGKVCQLACVNLMGAVNFNPPYDIPITGQCSDNFYMATATTPCPPPT